MLVILVLHKHHSSNNHLGWPQTRLYINTTLIYCPVGIFILRELVWYSYDFCYRYCYYRKVIIHYINVHLFYSMCKINISTCMHTHIYIYFIFIIISIIIILNTHDVCIDSSTCMWTPVDPQRPFGWNHDPFDVRISELGACSSCLVPGGSFGGHHVWTKPGKTWNHPWQLQS